MFFSYRKIAIYWSNFMRRGVVTANSLLLSKFSGSMFLTVSDNINIFLREMYTLLTIPLNRWAKAANLLQKQPVKLAKCDATIAKKLAERFGIRGFPTIKYFKNGAASDYGGGRQSAEIVSWVLKKLGPVTTTVSSIDDYNKLDESNDVFILGVFSSLDDPEAKIFLQLANEDESLPYATSVTPEIKELLGLQAASTIVVVKDFDDRRADLEISSDAEKPVLASFIAGNSIPLIQEFSMESSKKIFSSPIKVDQVFTSSIFHRSERQFSSSFTLPVSDPRFVLH